MSHSMMRRVVLLAVAQCCFAGLVKTAHADGRPSAWSDLWRTPDEQGRALLDAGQPADAAARFHDPRWQAYADLEAARYPQAAKLLAPFTDADSEYNHGNALAESGQLEAALAAYDAALRLAPGDPDIRHNRDLVERALRQQQQSRRNGSGSQQSGGSGPQSNGSGRMASSGSRAGAGQSGSSGQQPNSPQASSERRAGRSRDAAGEARRDATFAQSVARAQQQQGGSHNAGRPQAATKGAGQGPAQDSLAAGGTQTPQQKPETERQLMLDEWLRQIPDNPAGLLRRQFLIDHMMRQQNGPGSAP
jgi:Ca-activated chloride channel homolog